MATQDNRDLVAVLYVARGGPGGLATTARFVDAYLACPAGWVHELVFLAKGWNAHADRQQMQMLAASCGARTIDLADDGFDWGAYFRSARLLTQPWLCLLNSHARPCVRNWLMLLMQIALKQPRGLVGATGSWESPRWRYRPGLSLLTGARELAYEARHIRHLQRFDRFPNPHLRSSGPVISRELFCLFGSCNQLPTTKAEAHFLESGRSGLSAFVRSAGGALVVAGADGQAYARHQWPMSMTFRSGSQVNLIIRDNRTDQYELADARTRSLLTMAAWRRPRP